jgi:hypothetical protein
MRLTAQQEPRIGLAMIAMLDEKLQDQAVGR